MRSLTQIPDGSVSNDDGRRPPPAVPSGAVLPHVYWHGRLHLIDHGATLTFQHSWAGAERWAARPYDARDHVLVGCRPDVAAADAALAPDYLGSRIHLDVDRLRALDPAADPVVVERALCAAADICGGDPDAGSPAREELGRRFRWLTAPRSTVVQPGPVHTGLTADPDADADRLLRLLVLPVGSAGRPRD